MKRFSEKGVSLNDLPKTRKEQFKLILKNEFTTFVKIGLLILASLIPLLLVIFAKNEITAGVAQTIIDQEGTTMQDMVFNDFIINALFDLSNFITFLPIAAVLAATYRVFRNLAFGDGLLFREDAAKGLKVNFSNTYKCMCVFNALLMIHYFIKFLLFFYANETIASILTEVSVGILFLCIATYLIFFAMNSIYNIKTMEGIRSSTLLMIKQIWISLICFALLFIFRIIFLSVYLSISLIIILIVVIFGLPILLMMYFMCSVALFDKHINDKYPEIKFKGLYVEETKK